MYTALGDSGHEIWDTGDSLWCKYLLMSMSMSDCSWDQAGTVWTPDHLVTLDTGHWHWHGDTRVTWHADMSSTDILKQSILIFIIKDKSIKILLYHYNIIINQHCLKCLKIFDISNLVEISNFLLLVLATILAIDHRLWHVFWILIFGQVL